MHSETFAEILLSLDLLLLPIVHCDPAMASKMFWRTIIECSSADWKIENGASYRRMNLLSVYATGFTEEAIRQHHISDQAPHVSCKRSKG
jgi:hypothetical protein